MKRMLCLFLALILAVGICFSAPVTITASAAFTLESGAEHTVGAVYIDSTTGVKFKITDIETKQVEVCGYSNLQQNLVIPATVNISENGGGTLAYSVTAIGASAFYGCKYLTTIEIPNSVTTIDYGAFCDCTALESVTIGDSVTTIGASAFYYCTSLASVTIPDSVKTIGEGAFCDCTALTSVTIPDSVTTIGRYAFQGCTLLASVTIGKGVKEIKDDAFDCCNNLSTVNVPCNWDGSVYKFAENKLEFAPHTYENGKCIVEGCGYACAHGTPDEKGICTVCRIAEGTCGENVTWIYDSKTTTLTISGTGAMADYTGYDMPWCNYQNNITKVVIENGVTTIGEFAFNYCSFLTSVTIPESVTSIGNFAFAKCTSLEAVTIGEAVTTIGDYAFAYCSFLTSVTMGDSVTSIGDSAFEECAGLTSVTIPDSVTTIRGLAFLNCSNLTSVTIPKNVTTIDRYAFAGCAKLISINVDGANTKYSSEDGVLFNKDKTELIYYPLGKTETSYTIPESVTTIDEGAFKDCTALTSVTIGKGVTEIDDYAFDGCENVNLIVEPGSKAHNYAKTNSIPYTFNGYTEAETEQIKKLTFTEMRNDNEVIAYSVTGCDTQISGELKIPATYNGKPVTEIGIHAFSSCISLETVTIGNSVTSIGDYAFSACTALATVTIPDSVTTIGNYTFNACTALATVTIPDSITTIGNYTFNACTALTSVTIPGSETTIGNNAFNGCTKILLFVNKDNTNVKDYATTNNINYVVDGSGELEKLTFTPIYKEADNENSEITGYSVTGCDKSISGELKIPATYNGKPVTKIGNNAFSNCKSLTSVVIPDSVVSLGEKAFYFCDSLETVTLSSNITVIPNDAFAYCLSLKKLPITENITSIGERAFYDSGEHGSVSLSGVTLDADAFRSCGITELTLVRCKLNDASVFINNDIEKLTLSETNIPDEMFDGDSYIKTLVAENSVLGSRSFKGCSSLKSVTFSGGEINAEAFVACSLLETVTIDNIGSVGENAFNNCQALKTVEVDATKISEGAFALCDSLKNVKLGDELEVIEKNAFEECRELTEIVIPESVTTIGNDAFSGCGNMTLTVVLGSYAHQFAKTNNIPYIFNGYNKAETAQIEKLTFTLNADSESYSVTGCDTSISGALTIPSTYNGKHVTAIGNNAFWNCKSLTSVVIPDSVVSLGEKAFYVCDSLETVTLSSNITVIPNEAFAYCESLKTLPITEKITRIGKSAFYGSGKYSKVSLSGVTIGSEAFQFCGITELTLKNCELNDVSVFINNKIEKLTLSETDIPDEMFYGNSHIKTLVAENSVLGSSAFSDCRILENVTVSGGEIKSDAFWACPSLETVTIDNIGSVGEYAFYNCQALKTVEVNATEISKYAFSMSTSLENVKLSDGVEVIGNAVFENCTSLAELELPETVTKIGKWVFNGCDLLTELVIPESVAEISDGAFVGCSNLKYVFFEGTEDAQKTIGDALETNAKIHYGSSTHTFNENYTVDVEPTCTEKGSKSQHCKYCDLTQNVTIIDELGHTPVKGGTESAHTICSVCKVPLSTTHNLTSKITTAPTCTEEGVETFTCECGYTYTKPVEAKGHDIVIDKAVAATCTETGLTEGSHCSRCNGATVAQKEVSALGHTTSVINKKDATCTADGYTGDTYCSVCKTTTAKGTVIKATGHKEVVIPAVAPTFTTVGKTEGKKCSVCGTITVAQKDVAKLTLATPTVTQKNTAKGIQVNWNKIDGAESYVVYRSVYSGGKWSKWASIKKGVTGTSYVDGTVKLGTSYKYTVRAVNGSVMSGYQNTKDGLKYNVTPTVKVALASNGIKVSWSTAANATGYTVYSSTYNTKTKKWSGWKIRGTVKASKTSWTDKSVKSGTQYKYTIRAVNGKVLSSYNKTGAATLYLAQPTVKIANASTGVKVSWSKVTGATGYTVYRSEYKNGAWTKWASRGTAKANKTSWTDTKVASGVQYKYTVRAINGKVASTYVSSNTVLYLAQPKTTVKAVSNGINVAWTQSTGATGYTVYRMEYNTKTKKWSGWKKMGTAKASKTNWTDKSAKKGVQYKYTVKAVNGKVASTYKASGSVKR